MDKFWKTIEAFHVPIASVVFIISIILMVLVQLPTPEALNPFGCMFLIIAMASGWKVVIDILFSIEGTAALSKEINYVGSPFSLRSFF